MGWTGSKLPHRSGYLFSPSAQVDQKYEAVTLHPQNCIEAREYNGRYLTFCNGRHPHLSPALQTAGGFHLNANSTNVEEHNRS